MCFFFIPSKNNIRSSKTFRMTESCCILKSLNSSLPDIPLRHGETKIIGRGSLTKIVEKRCSKTQVEVRPNLSKKSVIIKQLGPNHSAINGKVIGIGLDAEGQPGDTLHLLLGGNLNYKLVFEESSDSHLEEDSPPKKIPKMFLPRCAADEYKKDGGGGLLKGSWESKGKGDMDLLVYIYGDEEETIKKEPSTRIAAFDLDGTLITTKSGKSFPTSPEDWKFLYPQTVEHLQNYFRSNESTKFVIFTNQGGIKDAGGLSSWKNKVEKIGRALNIPFLLFASLKKNKYRKPLGGSWELLVQEYNGGVVPRAEDSFFCGDAAGRTGVGGGGGGGRKGLKDHAASDRFFASNIGIGFKTPEEFFLNSSRLYEISAPSFEPKKYLEKSLHNDHVQFGKAQEMIIMVGYPASGKSTYVKDTILPKGYIHVNRDTLKTPAKCLSTAENALKNGDSVVIDNTNPEAKDRLEYIKLAKKHGVGLRCFKMSVDHAHALHNNKFREIMTEGASSVPAVAYNTFKSRYQEPSMNEGYSEIVQINFVPNFEKFEPSEQEMRSKLYSSYLLER